MQTPVTSLSKCGSEQHVKGAQPAGGGLTGWTASAPREMAAEMMEGTDRYDSEEGASPMHTASSASCRGTGAEGGRARVLGGKAQGKQGRAQDGWHLAARQCT